MEEEGPFGLEDFLRPEEVLFLSGILYFLKGEVFVMIFHDGFVVANEKVLEESFFAVELVDDFQNLLNRMVFVLQVKLSHDCGYFV